MTEGVVQFRLRPGSLEKIREAAAYGFLNYGLAILASAQARVPVRGGHRSFQAGAHLGGPLGIQDVGSPRRRAAGTGIGGTLRRSLHVAAYLDGRRISPASADENSQPLPDYVPLMGIAVFVGTNSGYGFWVHDGTSKMAARPFLAEAFNETRGEAPALIRAGTRRRLGQ